MIAALAAAGFEGAARRLERYDAALARRRGRARSSAVSPRTSSGSSGEPMRNVS
jgi:hypothetical protein